MTSDTAIMTKEFGYDPTESSKIIFSHHFISFFFPLRLDKKSLIHLCGGHSSVHCIEKADFFLGAWRWGEENKCIERI